MALTRPVFVIGAGRSGSTVFHHLLTRHPRSAWLSAYLDRHPDRPAVHRALLRCAGVPVVGSAVRRWSAPSEAYDFWDSRFRGFRRPCRDLQAHDVTPRVRESIREALGQVVAGRRDRLLVKLTGWPRIGFLRVIFEDARFIHLVRDGRAVAHSLLNVAFWRGWEGPEHWRWGTLTPEQEEQWRRHGRSFVVLAGLQWSILMDAVGAARRSLPSDDFMEVKYEDLCADPMQVFGDVAAFCDLDLDASFEKALHERPLRNTNHKWRQGLTEEQQAALEQVVRPHLERFGYT